MSSNLQEFEAFEDAFQRRFDLINLPFNPRIVITVQLLSCKIATIPLIERVSKLNKYNLQIAVECQKAEEEQAKSFKTLHSPTKSSTNISNTFKFVLPNDTKSDEEIPVEFGVGLQQLFLSRVVFKKQTINASTLPQDGTFVTKTLFFNRPRVELSIAISKSLRTTPDFRHSLGLCPEEKAFRKKRIPRVCEAMKKLLGEESGPESPIETPVVSVMGSGGGYRAMCAMSGAMAALQDAELMDAITYLSGVSGSAWYIISAYSLGGVKQKEQASHQKIIKDGLKPCAITSAILERKISHSYIEYLRKSNKTSRFPHTLANYFPGYVIGSKILKEQVSGKLSDLIPYVETAAVPYPIVVATNVKSKVKSSEYHTYMERTPYEISYPSYGISLKTTDESSDWFGGFRLKQCAEYALHFTIAMIGCGFCILLNSLKNGGEFDKSFLDYLEDQRYKRRNTIEGINQIRPSKSLNNIRAFSEKEISIELLEKINGSANYDLDRFTNKLDSNYNEQKFTLITDDNESSCNSSSNSSDDDDEMDVELFSPTLEKFLSGTRKSVRRESKDVISRNALVGRTVRVPNFALGLEDMKRFPLNPMTDCKGPNVKNHENQKVFGGQSNIKYKMSTSKEFLNIADAGLLNNVATDIVLRPQRTTDILIVMDFNAYEDDDNFDYQPLLLAASHAWHSGIEMPEINFDQVSNLPPKELLIFPSHGPNCPTILWFTLSNKKFKQISNYVPRCKANFSDKKTGKFNDFKVYGEGTHYETLKFQIKGHKFDQLRELMYYNVQTHIEDIKSAISDAVIRKRERLSMTANSTITRLRKRGVSCSVYKHV